MKPLIVLLGAFALALLLIKVAKGCFNFALAGCIAMSAMLTFTAVAHFTFTRGMALMVPGFIPAKTPVIYATGIMEFVAAIGLLIPSVRVLTAWLLVVFFVLILPANISAAIRRIDYQKGSSDGSGPSYLWFRVPLQLLFIAWTYLAAISGVGKCF